jgi:hypothetical protein
MLNTQHRPREPIFTRSTPRYIATAEDLRVSEFEERRSGPKSLPFTGSRLPVFKVWSLQNPVTDTDCPKLPRIPEYILVSASRRDRYVTDRLIHKSS